MGVLLLVCVLNLLTANKASANFNTYQPLVCAGGDAYNLALNHFGSCCAVLLNCTTAAGWQSWAAANNATACYEVRYSEVGTDNRFRYTDCQPSPPPTEILQCESDVVKSMTDEWSVYENNVIQENIFTVSPNAQGEIILTDYTASRCFNTGVKTDQNDANSEDVYCRVTRSSTQSLTDDNTISELTIISSIEDVPNGASDLTCNGVEILSNANDTTVVLSPSAEATEMATTDSGDTVTTETSSYETTEYEPGTNTTLRCITTITTTIRSGTSGTSSNDSSAENCTRSSGDSTEEGRGSGTNVVMNSDGSTTVTSNNGGITTSDTPQVSAEIEGIDELLAEIEGLCDDPNGCEDFAEILEAYDAAQTDSSIAASTTTLSDAVTALETGISGTTAESLVTGIGVITDGTTQAFNVFTSVSCSAFVLPFEGGAESISCSDTEGLRIVITLMAWLYLVMHLRQILTRPSAFSG